MEDHIYRVALQLWTVTLGLPLERVEQQQPAARSELMAGKVELCGAWNGAIELRCAVEVVQRAAAVMFGLPPEGVEAPHLRDVLGELTNVIGGNIKRLLPKPTDMSTPSFEASGGGEQGANAVRLLCDCEGGQVEVLLIEHIVE